MSWKIPKPRWTLGGYRSISVKSRRTLGHLRLMYIYVYIYIYTIYMLLDIPKSVTTACLIIFLCSLKQSRVVCLENGKFRTAAHIGWSCSSAGKAFVLGVSLGELLISGDGHQSIDRDSETL